MQRQGTGKHHTVYVFGFSVLVWNTKYLGSLSQKKNGDKKQEPHSIHKVLFPNKTLCSSAKTVYKLC